MLKNGTLIVIIYMTNQLCVLRQNAIITRVWLKITTKIDLGLRFYYFLSV